MSPHLPERTNEQIASDRLPAHVRDYVAATAAPHAGADTDAWDRIRVVPRVFTPGGGDLATTVLGVPVPSPVLVAPMAQQVAAHPDGECETGAAVAARGSILGVSTNTAVMFDRIAATKARWWFQIYPLADRGVTRALVERAAAAGAQAIILTVDTTPFAAVAPHLEPAAWPAGPESARLANLSDDEKASLRGRPSVPATLTDISWLTEVSGGLPVVVKGVLHPDDALAAVDHGAAAVIVSTHGGRRSSLSIPAAEALPVVVDALTGTAAEVYVDSGIRSGDHVLAALSLGARAVFVGRPVWWALAAGGAPAVTTELDRVDAALRVAVRQAGMSSVTDLPRMIARGPRSAT